MPKRSQYADEDSKLRGAIFPNAELAQESFRAHLNGPAGRPRGRTWRGGA